MTTADSPLSRKTRRRRAAALHACYRFPRMMPARPRRPLPRMRRLEGSGMTLCDLASEAVEIVMIADAIPQPTIRHFYTYGPVAFGDPYGPLPWSFGNWLEKEAWMSGIRAPKLKCLVSGPSNVGWQGFVQLPEAPRAMGIHIGKFRVCPLACSFSAFFTIESSFSLAFLR